MASIAKVIEISAESPDSFEDAIQDGVKRASRTVENIKGVWVNEMKADVENDEIHTYRVNMKVTFLVSH